MTWKSTRDWTNRIITAIDEGVLDPYDVALMALQYMSESEVEDMAHSNDLVPLLETDEEREDE